MNIRQVESRDIPAIMNIYRYYVDNTDISFEYRLPPEAEFRKRVQNIVSRYPYLVAEENGYLVGYAYAASFKDREAYDWACEISIYLRPDQKRRGTGTILLQELERILADMHICSLNACITWPNPASVAFHEKMGFHKAAHFEKCGYKFGRWIDMIWMQKNTDPLPESPEPVRWMNREL